MERIPEIQPLSEDKERVDKKFEHYAEEITMAALGLIEDSFEKPSDPESILEFHGKGHTMAVAERGEEILRAMKENGVDGITEKDMSLGKIAFISHDTVQDWEREEKDDKVLLKRFWGTNEEASSDWGIKMMEEVNKKEGERIFSEEDMGKVKEGVLSTVPDFDVELLTVFQKNLNEDSSPIARAMALADLGDAGMGGSDVFREAGDSFFREENLDMRNLGLGDFTDEHKVRMQKWADSQVAFVEGRKALFEKELGNLPEKAKEAIRRLFGKFDESIEGAKVNIERRKVLSVEELYKDMGYSL